jgi:hypothetical protein
MDAGEYLLAWMRSWSLHYQPLADVFQYLKDYDTYSVS